MNRMEFISKDVWENIVVGYLCPSQDTIRSRFKKVMDELSLIHSMVRSMDKIRSACETKYFPFHRDCFEGIKCLTCRKDTIIMIKVDLKTGLFAPDKR